MHAAFLALLFLQGSAGPAAPPATRLAIDPPALARAAGCAIRNRMPAIIALIDTEPNSPPERDALEALYPAFRRCHFDGHAEDETGRATLRAALSRALYLETLASTRWKPEQTQSFGMADFAAADRAFGQAAVMQRPLRLALCSVMRAPDEADRLVRSEPRSTTEQRTFAALMPTLTACVNRGEQVAVTPSLYRTAVEIAFTYRISVLLKAFSGS